MRSLNVGGLAAMVAQAVFLIVIVSLGACGKFTGGTIGGSDPDDSSISCERGIQNDGKCINAPNCNGNLANCLNGFFCDSTTDQCKPRVACLSEADCHNNPCVDGACVNPIKCVTDSQCVPGDLCDRDKKQCIEGACPGGCERGICSSVAGRCENKEFCRIDTESTDCIEGYICANGACINEALTCNNLNCQRGVCSPRKNKCVDAASCSDNLECLAGNYCSVNGICEKSKCNDGKCDAEGGICNDKTGVCEEPEICTASEECFLSHVCVNGKCKKDDQLCDPKCPGNQSCEYDRITLKATCVEPNSCVNTVDCTGDRICISQQCRDDGAQNCIPDAFDASSQDNGSINHAVDFAAEANDHEISNLTLCENDVDYFKVAVSEYLPPYGLKVTVEIENEDVGIDAVMVELFSADNTLMNQGRNDNRGEFTNQVVVVQEIAKGPSSSGYAYVKVSREHSKPKIPIRYKLMIEKIHIDQYELCLNKKEVEPVQTPDGGFKASWTATTAPTQSSISAMSHSCSHDLDGKVPDLIYQFTLDTEAYLEVTATAMTTENDLVLVIRSSCFDDSQNGRCVNETGPGKGEKIEGIYPAGTYSLIVTSKTLSQTGTFNLNLKATPTTCKPTDRVCIPGTNNLSRCNATQTAMEEVTCALACDPDLKQCLEERGQTCVTGIPVHKDKPFRAEVDFGGLNGVIDLKGKCQTTSSSTRGSELIFEVTVPNDFAIRATMGDIPEYRRSAIYILETCDSEPSSCLASADKNGSRGGEFVLWENTSGNEKTVFVVADGSDVRPSSLPKSQLIEIEVVQLQCEPGETRCHKDRELQTCDHRGSGFTIINRCDLEAGCNHSTTPNACHPPKGDTCSDAISLNGTLREQRLEYANNSYGKPTCHAGHTIGYRDQGSAELVYTITPNVGDAVTISVSPSAGFDPRIWLFESCDPSEVPENICTYHIDESKRDGIEETYTFIATENKPYYFVVESRKETIPDDATFDITLTKQIPSCSGEPICDPSTNKITYCDDYKLTRVYDCGTIGCTNSPMARCNQPSSGATGDSCVDPIFLDRGPSLATLSGTEVGKFNASALTDQITLEGRGLFVGQCMIADEPRSETKGKELVYAVSLKTGETIDLEVKTEHSALSFYLLTDCFRNQTCVGLKRNGKTKRLSYHAIKDETIYAVVDASSATVTASDFILTWNVTAVGSCVESTRECLDASRLSYCNDGNRTELLCHCHQGACRPDTSGAAQIPGDTCDVNPIPHLGKGGVVALDKNDLAALSNAEAPVCAGEPKGKDYFVKVSAQINDVIRVKGIGASVSSTAVYIFDDCNNVSSSCKAGDSGQHLNNDNETELVFLADATKDYYIGLDTTSESATAPLFYQIDVYTPECFPTDPYECVANGLSSVIKACRNYKKVVVAECAAGCGIVSGTCDTATGDFITDGIALNNPNQTPDVALDVDLSDKKDSSFILEPSEHGSFIYGSCIFNKNPSGPDIYYKIDLAEGDILDVSLSGLTTNNDSKIQLYLLGPENASNLSDSKTCIINDPESTSNADRKIKDFQAYVAGTYYIVVDAIDWVTVTQPLKLKYKVSSLPSGSICQPMTAQCLSGTQLKVCSQDGLQLETYSCPNGCSGRACLTTADATPLPNALNTCGAPSTTVHPISKSFMGTIDLTSSQLTNHILAGSASTGCETRGSTDKSDAFFPLSLQENDIVTLYMQRSNQYFQPNAFIFDDCANISATSEAATTCNAGVRIDNSNTLFEKVPLTFSAPQTGTYYLAIDASSYASSGTSTLFYIDIKQPECVPANHSNSCLTTGPFTGYIQFCGTNGLFSYYECQDRECSATATNSCNQPTGDVCHDAEPMTFMLDPLTGGRKATATGTYSGKTDTTKLCHPSFPQSGPDAFFKVELNENETVNIALKKTSAGGDVSLGLLAADCSCLQTVDTPNNPEELQYTVPTGKGGTYMIVADGYSSSDLAGEFELTVSVN